MKVAGEFAPLSFHKLIAYVHCMQVKTKYERNSSLEYHHMWENRRQKFKGTNKKPHFEVLVSTFMF